MSEFNPKTVNISSKLWMAENLAYDDGEEGITYNPENNEYYYTWKAAMRVAKKLGWKLPSDEDWDRACKECNGVNINNRYYDKCLLKNKLNIKLAGFYNNGFNFIGSHGFNFVGSRESFWSSSKYSSPYVWCRIFDNSSSVARSNRSETYGFSVRLIKDI